MDIEDQENNLNINETAFVNELYSKGWLTGPLNMELTLVSKMIAIIKLLEVASDV